MYLCSFNDHFVVHVNFRFFFIKYLPPLTSEIYNRPPGTNIIFARFDYHSLHTNTFTMWRGPFCLCHYQIWSHCFVCNCTIICLFMEWACLHWALFYIQHCPDGQEEHQNTALCLTWSAWERNTLIHSLTYPPTHSHIHPPTNSLTHPLTHSHIHSFTHSHIHPPTNSLTHSSTHSLTHPLIHSLAHLPDYQLIYQISSQDETLVHCSLTRMEVSDFTFEVEYGNDVFEVYVRLRPHFHAFLERVSRHFEVRIQNSNTEFWS